MLRSQYASNYVSGIGLSPDDEHALNMSMLGRAAGEREELREGLRDCTDRETELIRTVAHLEKQNRKLNDKLNRFRNVLPGRKRLITLGRIAAMLEYEADEDAKMTPTGSLVVEMRADALFLRRLEWDFEQAIDVVHEPKQARHEWPRP